MGKLRKLARVWRSLAGVVERDDQHRDLSPVIPSAKDRTVARILPALEQALAPLTQHCLTLERKLDVLEARLQQLTSGLETEAQQRRRTQWRRAGDLRGFEWKVSSQNGEDGILQEIFRRIQPRTRFFVEFGVETGVECNCAYLARQQQWSGLFLEADPTLFAVLQETYRAYPAVRCVQTRVTSETIETILAQQQVPAEFDLLSIDIDGNDYWVWAAIRHWQPRVVVIEYNAAHPPSRRWVMKEDPAYVWRGTNYHGASLSSLAALGGKKDYTLVGTDARGVNAFFVRNDCLTPGLFLDPVTHYHYSPFGYPPHAPHEGPYVEI